MYRVVNGETLLVNGITNKWYRLNQVGTQILERFERPATLKQIVERISEEFAIEEVSDDELCSDVHEFIEYLLQERMIRAESSPASPRGLIRIDDWRDELDAVGVELEVPIWAKIELSTACHLHCAHCYIPAPERSLKRELNCCSSTRRVE